MLRKSLVAVFVGVVVGGLYTSVAWGGNAPVGMVLIPSGSFQMGDSGTGTLDSYFMDTCDVTNAQYAAALNWACAQGGLITPGAVVRSWNGSLVYCNTTLSVFDSRITWNGSTFGVVAGKETHPMEQVSWYGAVAYANWRSAMQGKPLCYDPNTLTCNVTAAGYRLPTGAEWEKAARGGVDGHRFPWADTDTIQHARTNYCSSGTYSYDTSPTRGCHPAFLAGGLPYTSPVGYFAPNGYGLYDMAGNVWNWCNDGCTIRGGDWHSDAPYCACANSYTTSSTSMDSIIGFRLVLNWTGPRVLTVDLPNTALSGEINGYDTIHVVSGGSIVVPPAVWNPTTQEWDGGWLRLEADTIVIEPGGSIYADACGFSKDDGHSNGGPGKGRDYAPPPLYLSADGAGYGGRGGYYTTTIGPGGAEYGSESADETDMNNPYLFGSAGGDYCAVPGGRGGGCIRLKGNHTTIGGEVSADGGSGAMGAYPLEVRAVGAVAAGRS